MSLKRILPFLLVITLVFSKADILAAAQAEAANHTYVRFYYDCKHYSRDVRQILIDQFRGLDVLYRITVVRWDGYPSLHKFLRLPEQGMYIEATTGQEITPDMYSYYSL